MGKVLIKCIQTPMQKYFYDRSLDSVVMVNDEEYQILKTVEKTKLVPDGVLRRFVKSGLLRETAIEEIEHPETEQKYEEKQEQSPVFPITLHFQGLLHQASWTSPCRVWYPSGNHP